MNATLTTSKKIWISVAILLIGYCISMAFGILLGQKNLQQVQRVAKDWYPAARQLRQTASYFNGQIDLYNDALSLQDSELLALAESEAEKVRASLDTILESNSFTPQQLDVIIALQTDLQEFSSQAITAYGEAIRVLSDPELEKSAQGLQPRLVELAQQSEELHDRLQLEEQHFSTLLHDELLGVSIDLKHEQYLNVVVFFVVTIIGLTAIKVILTRSTREILDHDEVLDNILSGEIELGEAFFQLHSVSAKIVDEAESAAKHSSGSITLSQNTVEHVKKAEAEIQKLTTNIRDLSGKIAWLLERVPNFGLAIRKASRRVSSIDRELREIRNVALVLAELGGQLQEVTNFPDRLQIESLQLSALRVGEFADAILQRLDAIRQSIEGDVEVVSLVEKQGSELEGLVNAMKTTLDNQILETHHTSLLLEALQQEAGGLRETQTTLHAQTEHISQEGRLIQHETQKLLPMITHLHALVKTAKFKQQALRKHHISASKLSDAIKRSYED